jgi:hypothetical protein
MLQRFFLIYSSVLLLGSLGAVFMFVSILSIATVTLCLGGLMLMFGLGHQMGSARDFTFRSSKLQRGRRNDAWIYDRRESDDHIPLPAAEVPAYTESPIPGLS